MSEVMDTRQLDALFDELDRLLSDQELTGLLFHVGDRVGTLAEAHIRDSIPESPAGRPLPLYYTLDGKPSKFKSHKQRGKVFALAAEGKIPTKRTGFLFNSITHTTSIVDTGVLVRVGTNAPEGPYTLGDETQQSHYHKETGYVPIVETVERHTGEYRDVAIDTVRSYFAGLTGKVK